MKTGAHNFSVSRKGVLLDDGPMKKGKCPLVWDHEQKQWVLFKGTVGELIESIPITREEADAFRKNGILPARVSQR